MSHVELCPVCLGKGELIDNASTAGKKTCHGCGGRGWVEVGTDFPGETHKPQREQFFVKDWPQLVHYSR